MEEKFVCPRCGNKDPRKIGYRNGKPYCRLCISFKGNNAINTPTFEREIAYSLSYSLSNEQNSISNGLVSNYKNGINSFVHAVCGSGKTEIVLESIRYAISKGHKVGFAVPRRDVASELCGRFLGIFKKETVTLVCGGHNDYLYGDLVILTTHQLYRYEKYFDLLILDEVDAFPFNGNEVLNSFFYRSLKGTYIMMSATPDDKILEKHIKNGGKVFSLNTRFHRHPLPVPKISVFPAGLIFIKLLSLLKKFEKENKQVFIFGPTISICESLFSKLHILFSNKINIVHSKKFDRAKIIEDFRNKKYLFLVTTAVLERGVTVKDLQVVVYSANHSVYNRYNLVQISGRVGRKKEAPTGEVHYLATSCTKDMEDSIKDIQNANKDLQNML